MIITKGICQNSYLEAGYGRTDLFLTNKRSRKKIDGYGEVELGKGWSFFAQMLVDTDIGNGSDAVQSYIGFNYNLKKLSQMLSDYADAKKAKKAEEAKTKAAQDAKDKTAQDKRTTQPTTGATQ